MATYNGVRVPDFALIPPLPPPPAYNPAACYSLGIEVSFALDCPVSVVRAIAQSIKKERKETAK